MSSVYKSLITSLYNSTMDLELPDGVVQQDPSADEIISNMKEMVAFMRYQGTDESDIDTGVKLMLSDLKSGKFASLPHDADWQSLWNDEKSTKKAEKLISDIEAEFKQED